MLQAKPNHLGFPSGTEKGVVMALTEMAPPQRTRESKYNYSPEEIEQAFNSLFPKEKGKEPGSPADGPFQTTGQARSAANALILAMEAADSERGKQVGSRVWENEPDKWYFALKVGRKQGGGRPVGSTNKGSNGS